MKNTADFPDAEFMCKADEAWLVMPKTFDDIADIQVFNCESIENQINKKHKMFIECPSVLIQTKLQ